MDGDAITGFDPGKVSQHSCHFIHPDIQLLIGDGCVRFFLGLWHINKGSLILVFVQMPVDAIVGSIDLAAHKPLPFHPLNTELNL